MSFVKHMTEGLRDQKEDSDFQQDKATTILKQEE